MSGQVKMPTIVPHPTVNSSTYCNFRMKLSYECLKILLQNIEKVLKTHVAVDDCSIQGFHVPGIGNLPRAYVVLKHGYMISADELIQHVNSRVPVIERILGGIVFVDKFARDPNGKLFHSLEKWDSKAQGIDDQIFHQPRVDVS